MSDLSKELRAQANQHPLDADLLMFDVAASEIETLEQERDQLAARVERLSRVLKDCAPNLQNRDELYGLKWAVCDIINESPAVSLVLHDAGVLDKFKDKLFVPHPRQCSYSQGYNKAMRSVLDELNARAADLRKQTAEQESK
jgi:hypothetical protein